MNQTDSDAVAFIKLSLSDEQALQFVAEENAKLLRDKRKSAFTGLAEGRRIDAGNDLKNLEIKLNESANDYTWFVRIPLFLQENYQYLFIEEEI